MITEYTLAHLTKLSLISGSLLPYPQMKNKTEKALLIGIIALCLLYLFLGLIYKPIICNDAINGMISLHNYIHGGEWNQFLNLSGNGTDVSAHELTWWAPGQYEIPYLLSKLCSISIGSSIVLLMFASISGGCLFYYKIFKLSSLGNKTILLSLLILLLQRFINIYFIQYNSSDLILFFYTPFYIYTYYQLCKTYPQKILLKIFLLTLLNFTGLFIKNSFVLFELAVNIFLIAEYFFHDKVDNKITPTRSDTPVYTRLSVLFPFVLANLLNYYFFLRLGTNPAQGDSLLMTLSAIITGIFLPVMEVLFASLSLSGIYGNFYQKIALSQQIAGMVMMVILMGTGYLLYREKNGIRNLLGKDAVFRLAMITAVVYVSSWFVFTVKQSAVSGEDRLFLPVTILIIPYLLNHSSTTASKIKYVYFAFVGISILYGIGTFAYRIKKYSINGSVWSKNSRLNGFKIYSDNKDATRELDKVAHIISQNFAKDYIVVSNPDIAFQLDITNKFIVNTSTSFSNSSHLKAGIHYMLVVQLGKDTPPMGLNKLYSSNKYSLFRSN
ncbi:MAG: hypothetical protein JWR38_5234 [Mucilaginibacter sp.]|nr:hypothetical protein [Mucilaginibacter sp.]